MASSTCAPSLEHGGNLPNQASFGDSLGLVEAPPTPSTCAPSLEHGGTLPNQEFPGDSLGLVEAPPIPSTCAPSLEHGDTLPNQEKEGHLVLLAAMKAMEIVDNLYTDKGYTHDVLVKLCRKEMDEADEGGHGSIALGYGEVGLLALHAILIAALPLCQPSSDLIFYDLGSGCGRAVLAAALLQPQRLQYCRGIELIRRLHKVAQEALLEYSTACSSRPEVSFQQGDFLEVDWSDADLYATAKPDVEAVSGDDESGGKIAGDA
eukprot:gene27149-2382_t